MTTADFLNIPSNWHGSFDAIERSCRSEIYHIVHSCTVLVFLFMLGKVKCYLPLGHLLSSDRPQSFNQAPLLE
jgi:hypothetical protein